MYQKAWLYSVSQVRSDNGQAVLKAVRRFERHPEEILRQLSIGKWEDTSLRQRPYLMQVYAQFHEVRRDPLVRDAYLRLLLHLHDIASFESTDLVITRYTSAGNYYAAALLAMARRWNEWRRVPETWKPSSHNPRRQFRELARHLFCEYDAPAFLEAAWFRGSDPAARTQQNWYIDIGKGFSLRSLKLPIRLTKRMAHSALTKVPATCSVEEGWRWAQVIGMGGSDALARAIVATRLGESLNEDGFWETVVLFFVENPMLDPSRVGPLIDYLWYERYSPRRPDERDRLPVRFTMKGRTPAALLLRMEAWHQRLAKQERIALESWEPSGIGAFAWNERDEGISGEAALRWSVEEITTAKGLVAEGRAMSHCVATYAASCARGHVSIWSLKAQSRHLLCPERVMTVAVNNGRVITEARGKRNALPDGGMANYGTRLSQEDQTLLQRARRVIARWAVTENLRLPPYLG